MATYSYESRHEANEKSRETAEAHREIWEGHELELLEEGWADDESTLPEIAELLGRTIEACRQKHYDIRRRTGQVKRAKSTKNSQWDRGWTSLEDMGY
jgi:hypothetical protein